MTRSRSGWSLVAAYAAVGGASQLLWLTYAPVTTAAAHRFGVSVAAIGWLANVFPLLYVVLGVPAGMALDRHPRGALAGGAALTALGGLVRLGGDSFGWALAGQLLIAIAQPFVLNAVTGVVAALPARSRPTGIAVGSAGLFLGMVVALGGGAAVGGGQIRFLAVSQAALALAVTLWLLVLLRRPDARVGSEGGAEPGELRRVWTDPVMRRIGALAFLGFGVFVALLTWLQALLEPRGVSESAAGVTVTVAVAVGAVGAAVLSALLEGRPVEVVLLRATLLAAAAGCAVLAVAHGVPVAAAGAVLAVAALLTALPWLLSLCERRTTSSVASATAVLWLSGNLGGLLAAGVVGELVHHPAAAFSLLALVALTGYPLVRARPLGLATEEVPA